MAKHRRKQSRTDPPEKRRGRTRGVPGSSKTSNRPQAGGTGIQPAPRIRRDRFDGGEDGRTRRRAFDPSLAEGKKRSRGTDRLRFRENEPCVIVKGVRFASSAQGGIGVLRLREAKNLVSIRGRHNFLRFDERLFRRRREIEQARGSRQVEGKRSGCPLVALALVLDASGFPKESEVFEANASEPRTLKQMISGFTAIRRERRARRSRSPRDSGRDSRRS